MKVLGLVLLVGLASATSAVSYKGYEVWSVDVSNANVRYELHSLKEKYNVDFWSETKDVIHMVVSPEQKDLLAGIFGRLGYNHEVIVTDVQEEIDKIQIPVSGDFDYNQYNTYDDIVLELKRIAKDDDKASLDSIGQSWQKREQWVISFSTNTNRAYRREALYFDCGTHAREWITVATCMWGINHFSTTYGNDAQTTAILDNFDVYILPVVNPDGYSYTFTDDRMWRKNRRLNSGSTCIGVDLNRNFDDNFGGIGTSSSACSEIYHGPYAASERETHNVQEFFKLLRDNNNLNTMYSLHSYSQLWMWPYGSTDTLCPDNAELERDAQIGYEALRAVDGTYYELGPIYSTIYPASSTTVDYAYKIGLTYSYTLELRPRGGPGFLLPASLINITATETWAGLKAAVLAMPAFG